MKSYRNVVLFSLLAFACDTIIEIDLPENQNFVVINGLAPADSAWLLRVTSSVGALTEVDFRGFKGIENASVVVSGENGENTELDFIISPPEFVDCNFEDCDRYGYYYSERNPAIAGETYTINVQVPNLGEASSTFEIPTPVEIEKADLETTSSNVNSREENGEITFTDNPNEQDFYIFQLYFSAGFPQDICDSTGVYVRTDTVFFFNNARLSSPDPSVINPDNDSNEFSKNFLLLNDVLFNGQNFKLNFKAEIFSNSDELIFELKHISEDYYRYLLSIENYNFSDGNPFAEPVQVYSNVENGFGIVAAYASDTLVLKK
ncbi:MAG: DUF4249 domain-containing protein [Bacteroidota bacterium]